MKSSRSFIVPAQGCSAETNDAGATAAKRQAGVPETPLTPDAARLAGDSSAGCCATVAMELTNADARETPPKFILAPIDFSEGTSRVLAAAAQLAGDLGARVILLHVVVVPRCSAATHAFGARTEMAAALREIAEGRLDEARVTLLARGVAADAFCLTGNPASRIVEQARKLAAECIVLGSHGHAARRDLIVGGTVNALLKRTHCAVAIVPTRRIPVRNRAALGCVERRCPPARTILAPVDFSRTTPSVVARATQLARGAAAQLVLLNVTRPATLLEEHRKLEELAERAFASSALALDGKNLVRGDALELLGPTAPVILDQARRLAVDYIVMGSRRPGRSALKVLGTTAGNVIREATCPVILVRPPPPLRVRAAFRSRDQMRREARDSCAAATSRL